MKIQRRAEGGNLQATLAQAMAQALSLYSAREWGQAEQVCRMILSAQAAHFDALNLAGIITAQTNRPLEAVEFLGRAVALRRNDAVAQNNYGNVLRTLARYEDALRAYNRAIQVKPNYVEAHYNRGVTLHELGKYDDAIASYGRALAYKSDYVAAYNNRGVTLYELKRFDEAVASYDRAVALKPDYAAAYNNRGVALQALKRPGDALESYSRALAINADYAEALNNRGNALKELERFDEALESFARALALRPDYAQGYNGRGSTLQLLNRLDEALESYDRAVALEPGSAEVHYNRGNCLRALGRNELALESYERALDLKPDYADDYYNRGGILHDLKRFEEARESYRRALEINPEHPWLLGICLHERMRICDWTDLDSQLVELSAAVTAGRPATPPFVPATLVDSLALQRRAAEIWVAKTCPAQPGLPPIAQRERRTKLRVGYYSADYCHHATAHLAAGLFEKHDREQFEIVAFSFGPGQHDDMTDRLQRAFDQFVDVRAKTDVEVAALSREMSIDIAVDLKGFTQHQRPGIFVHRAAPIQVSYLGYPGTMGAPFIDYIVADETLIPAEARSGYAEKVVYLPGSYQVNDRTRVIADRQWTRSELGLPDEGFVFCCFNNVYKITPTMFACWMSILRKVKHSVLWLLEESTVASGKLRAAAAQADIDPRRLIFAPRMPPQEHLARHRMADLFIDTLPCNAHTTASDALWAGLPLLTCPGESFPSRVAASLLNAIGAPELVAGSLGEYEQLAVGLAEDPERLAGIAQRVREGRRTAPLFDTGLFARGLEEGFRQMYERYLAGLAPEHLRIPSPQLGSVA